MNFYQFRNIFGDKYTILREEFTADDEANLRDLLEMPHYQSLKRKIMNRIADLNGDVVSTKDVKLVDRIEELFNLLKGLENLSKNRPQPNEL